MDIANDEDEPLVVGVQLLSEVDPFPILKPQSIPQGDFVLVHEVDDYVDATRETLGQQVIMYYLEAGT